MRRKSPMEVEPDWKHPLPMPMPYQPVCVTELEALEQISLLSYEPRIFMWTDAQRRCIANWEFLASVRQGVPPQGIEAELQAWMNQYPDSWLVVDLSMVLCLHQPQFLFKNFWQNFQELY